MSQKRHPSFVPVDDKLYPPGAEMSQLYESRVHFLWWRIRDPDFSGYRIRDPLKGNEYEPYLLAVYPPWMRLFLRVRWVALRR